MIAYGKVLDSDEKTAGDFNIKENDFIVAMVQKARPPPKAKAEEPKKEEVKKEEAPATTAASNPPAQAQPAAQTQPPAQAQPAATSQPAASQQLSPEVEAAVNELMAISGKPKELCTQALAAAQGIPDVAFEFLMSGHIPQPPAGGGANAGGAPDDQDYGDEGEDGGDPLAQYNLDPATL